MSGPASGSARRIAVVGGGISGLAAAWELVKAGHSVEVFESSSRWGGKVASSSFGGLDGIDEGADAFLARVPEARALAVELGLGDDLVSPATGSALVVRRDRLYPIPDGLVLGVPVGLGGLARSGLLSWPGKARAAIEPLLPRRDHGDSLGRLVAQRFGGEVSRYLVDPLVGSINAGDSDRLSLAASVPQIAGPAARHRSLLLGLRSGAAQRPDGPVFLTPRRGMATLVDALVDALRAAGARMSGGVQVEEIASSGGGWSIAAAGMEHHHVDGLIVATPAAAAARLLGGVAPRAAASLAGIDAAGVVMLTALVPTAELAGVGAMSGYLVPKPEQRHVTAVSFSSRKWAHWSVPGQEILRISLGRDGNAEPLTFDDERLEADAMGEVGRHLGLGRALRADAVRITRWPGAFPQYRPGHQTVVERIESELAAEAPRIVVAGASYRGIGLPACIRDGVRSAHLLSERCTERPD